MNGFEPRDPIRPELEGQIAEGIVCQELQRISKDVGYWSGKKEIDFVPSLIEVKYQNRVSPHEFLWFEKTFSKRKNLLVLTKNDHFHLGPIKGVPLKEWLLSDKSFSS
ncbi:MAG: ATP-binding protein [Chlamydiae bacterium]|nr:ATP-binding protein [Chlamydiota bacterium]MBI3276742.1 ATP-binding protein [Chlamydiota bacterium]